MALQSNVQSVKCVYCGEGHYFAQCPGNPEQVNFVNKNGPFSQTYNRGWRQHPNFSWSGPASSPPTQKPQEQYNFQNQGQSNSNSQHHQGNHYNQQGHFQSNQSGYQSRSKQNAESSVSLETLMKEFTTQLQASIKNLETQLGEMALEIRKRPVGTLSNDTEIPKRDGTEHVKAATLRSENILPENIQKDSEPPIKAVPEKVPTTSTFVIPAQTPDITGPKNTSKPRNVTRIPEKSDFALLFLKEPPTVQKPQERIIVDLSHSGASPAIIPKNPALVKPLVEPVLQTPSSLGEILGIGGSGNDEEKAGLKDVKAPLKFVAFEVLEAEDKKTLVPSLEVAPELELKQLPSHLKLAFLGDLEKLSVIISSSLEADQEVILEVSHEMKYPDKIDKCTPFCIHDFLAHVKDVLRKGLKHKWKEKMVTNCSSSQVP